MLRCIMPTINVPLADLVRPRVNEKLATIYRAAEHDIWPWGDVFTGDILASSRATYSIERGAPPSLWCSAWLRYYPPDRTFDDFASLYIDLDTRR